MPNLNLNEALVTVDKSKYAGPVEVFYQNSECYGCQLKKFTTLNENLQDIVLDTRYGLQLEFRRENAKQSAPLCSFDRLDLNSHGHYRIDINVNISEPSSARSSCDFQIVNQGECMLCPFAVLLCFLVIVTAAEKLFKWFGNKKRQVKDDPVNEDATSPSGSQEKSTSRTNSDGQAQADDTRQQTTVSNETSTSETNAETRKRTRIDALDAFRGLTITGMIMVNYGGAGYMILEHKPWNGLTLADFVFPFFVFSMGASIAISMRSSIRRDDQNLRSIITKIVKRSMILMALGLCLNSKWLNGRDLSYLRLTGVLQRFSISYLVVAITYAVELTLDRWLRTLSISRLPFVSRVIGAILELITAFSCLSIYIYMTYFFEYSKECPIGYLGPGGMTENGRYANCTGGAAAWLDHTILGNNHIYRDTELKHVFGATLTHDPEGLLGYTTSILLTLVGLQCGKILTKRSNTHKQRLMFMSQSLIIMALLSVAVIANPINKKLWSLTFVAVTSASAYLVVISFYIMLDIYNCQRVFVLRLLLSAGKNAIFLYVGHSLLHEMLPWHFAVNEASHLQLTMRLTWSTLVWLLIANYMASKRLFIKI